MFLGLTIGHLVRPQRPCRCARFFEMLAKASMFLVSLLSRSLLIVPMSAGSPILAMDSIILLTCWLIAFSEWLAASAIAWKKSSLSSTTVMPGLSWAKNDKRAWSILELALVSFCET